MNDNLKKGPRKERNLEILEIKKYRNQRKKEVDLDSKQ